MQITRRSALKKLGTIVGSTALLGATGASAEAAGSTDAPSGKDNFNVRDYGAKGNGRADDTGVINQAIATAAKSGGGKVCFPAGTYRSGSIRLKSHITLYLGQGAVLEATDDAKAYDQPEPFQGPQYQDFGHSHWHNGFIWGENLHDITIEGPGVIYGKGLLRHVGKNPSQKMVGGRLVGDKAIALKECRSVTLRDFTIKHGGHFGVLPTGVENFTIDNLLIDTNRDGINIDCCRNVHISNCTVNSPRDDGIVLKSSYALGRAQATQNVTITNCIVSGFKEGTVLDNTYQTDTKRSQPVGRIKFGTESNGGFKNITISNCTFQHCRGLALETVDGGPLEDVSISNLTMRDIAYTPIFMRLGSRLRGPKGTTVGQLRRVNISNIVVHNAAIRTGVLASGIPGHRIEDIKISDVHIGYEGGGTKKEATITPPEKMEAYPNPNRFGILPSYGFYLRHMKGIELSNIKLTFAKKDYRPPFALSDVSEADFRFIKAQHEPDVPVFSLHDVEDFRAFQVDKLENKTLKNIKEKKI
jgi:polygalacturonase